MENIQELKCKLSREMETLRNNFKMLDENITEMKKAIWSHQYTANNEKGVSELKDMSKELPKLKSKRQ